MAAYMAFDVITVFALVTGRRKLCMAEFILMFLFGSIFMTTAGIRANVLANK